MNTKPVLLARTTCPAQPSHERAPGKRVLEKVIPARILLGATRLLPKQEVTSLNVHLKNLLLSAQLANALKSFGLCHSCRFNRRTSEGYFCALTEEPLKESDVSLICREHEYPQES